VRLLSLNPFPVSGMPLKSTAAKDVTAPFNSITFVPSFAKIGRILQNLWIWTHVTNLCHFRWPADKTLSPASL